MNVTVTRRGKKTGKGALAARYTVAFDALPGKTFGSYGFAEMCRDLTVSAPLEPVEARALVLDAWTHGHATRETGAAEILTAAPPPEAIGTTPTSLITGGGA